MSRGGSSILLLAIASMLGFGCTSSRDPDDVPLPSPGLELSKVDYPTARSHFRTRLVREGPASPAVADWKRPADAVESSYQSGTLTLQSLVSPPTSSVPRKPAVLFLHGGFELGEKHWAMTRPFRDAGFVVMIPSLRGENGQPGSFSLFYDELQDVLAAADFLASRPDVDPKRLYVAGHSVGGTLALMAALTSPRFRAAASFSGSPDQVEYTRGRADRIPFDSGDRDEFRLSSPVVFATHFRCPVRLYHGEDEIWLQNSTRRTALLAKRAGLDVEDVEVEGGHDTANPEVIKSCITFVRSHGRVVGW